MNILLKRSSTVFLQAVIVLAGLGVLAFLLWEPHLEGVNRNAATLSEIYFDDPFLAYVYLGSIPFFAGLYQAFRVLRYVKQNRIFSEAAIRAVRVIKYCALLTTGAIVGADAFIMMMARSAEDDPAGAFALSIIAIFLSTVAAAAASVFEGLLRNGLQKEPV